MVLSLDPHRRRLIWLLVGAWVSTAEALASSQAAPQAPATHHWAFQPLHVFKPPAVTMRRWVRTDIDQFVLAKLEATGLKPARDADKRTLVRRVTFDLTGLPPTPAEIAAFLEDRSPGAFERVIDRLLASPQYGEKWGRHWLDLVRYADTSGCNSDYPVPSAYKYRNYVIHSFNVDKPYNQFLREQLAGDLLPAKNEAERYEHVVATGYLAISRRFGSRASEFHLTIEDTIDNVGKTMLGLSVSCARCHDHKFDPISTRDYYALYGIFQSTRYAFPGTEIYLHPKDFVPLATAAEADQYYRDTSELAGLDDRIENLLEQQRAFERLADAAPKGKATPGAATVERKDQAKVPKYQTPAEVKTAIEQTRERQRQLENKVYPFEKAYAVAEAKPADARIQKKGEPTSLGEQVPRGFLAILGGQTLTHTDQSGRGELADWITAPTNPLTARVMVNRIWEYHFGKGLVQTPNDFGARGKPPTHPDLLDYLAGRFIQDGWSIKRLHKLILLSHTYQMASEGDPKIEVLDANNDWLWKFDRRRLEAEEVRDAMLAISGALDRSPGGPHPFPPEATWKYTQHTPFVATYDSQHRSVYLMQQRIRRHPFFEVFDGADPNAPTPERASSTTPLQALFMMNNSFVHEQADQFARRVELAFADTPARLRHAYQLAYGRPASRGEIRAGEAYLRRCEATLAGSGLPPDQCAHQALVSLLRVVLSANEFIYVD